MRYQFFCDENTNLGLLSVFFVKKKMGRRYYSIIIWLQTNLV